MDEPAPSAITSSLLSSVIGTKFPALRKALDKCDGSAYSVCGRFGEFVNEAMRMGDAATAEAAMLLVADLLALGDDDLRNALYCDFCEVLDLRNDVGRRVFFSMSKSLQDLYLKAQEYLGDSFNPNA